MNLHPFLPVFHARSNSTGHEILLKMGVNSLGLHLYACLYIVWLSGQFGSLNLHRFTPNSTGQIRPAGQIRPGMKYWSNWE